MTAWCALSGRRMDLPDGKRFRCTLCGRRTLVVGGVIRKHHLPALSGPQSAADNKSREIHPSVAEVR